MAMALEFSISSSKVRFSANISHITSLSSLSHNPSSMCVQAPGWPTLNWLRLTVSCTGKSSTDTAVESVSCFEKAKCRFSSIARTMDVDKRDLLLREVTAGLHSRVFPSGAQESSRKVDKTSWVVGTTMAVDRAVDRNAKQAFRNDSLAVAPSDFPASTQELDSPMESGGARELMKGSVNPDIDVAKRLNAETACATFPHVERAWDHWKKLGAPKLIVAPMMDQSELPFRMLCRKYGATAAYTPMFHSRPFAISPGYRRVEFTTCPEDRPLFVQFGANDPEILLQAATFVQDHCDYVDINLGCPQRVAKRGGYGAFLMDDLPLIRSMVMKLVSELTTPVSCKIRIFPNLEETIAYAHMLEDAGCSLLAVHGRTRDQKDGKATRADWEVIRAVKEALRIPVLANGNVRWLEDVHECIRRTGVDGVLSAVSLLENPALFGGHRMRPLDSVTGGLDELSKEGSLNEPSLVLEYLDLCEKYPVPARMIRAHVYQILCPWFKRHPELRDELNNECGASIDWIRGLVFRLLAKHISLTAVVLPRESTKQHDASEKMSHPAQLGSPFQVF